MKTTIKISIFAFGLVFSSLCMANGYVGYDASIVSYKNDYVTSKDNLISQLGAGYLKEHNSSLQYGFEIAYSTTGQSSTEATMKYFLFLFPIDIDSHSVGSFTYQGSTALGLVHYQFAPKWHAVVKGGAEYTYFKAKTVFNKSTTFWQKTIVDDPITYFESATDLHPIIGLGIQYKLFPQFSLNANFQKRLLTSSSFKFASSYGSLGLRYHWA